MDSILSLAARIQVMSDAGARHHRRGYALADATPSVATNHVLEEAVEFQAAVLHGSRGEAEREAADLLLVYLHALQLANCDISIVIAFAHQKLGDTFTCDPAKVLVDKPTFTRAGRADHPETT
jgi:phosphoribosyl-ATP pyrophosphohydrolase